MFSRLYNYWQLTRDSLFYLPVVVCLFYIAGIAACYAVDTIYPESLAKVPFMYRGGIEDAKAIVRLLMSAMITMTTLAVSLTMVVLSLSASQLGPRLIKIFLSDRKTQIFIGVFFGSITFLFALLVILHDRSLARETPYLCVTAALAASFANLFVLLGFVSHVARGGIADNVISKVGDELQKSIRRLTKGSKGEENGRKKYIEGLEETFADARDVFSCAGGYVQTINYQTILALATERDIAVQLDVSAGHYVLAGEKIGRVSTPRDFTAEDEQSLIGAIVLGQVRTPSQDIEYSARHLVEVGLRALSPGINDNFTAISALDKLSSALGILLREDLPRRVFHDDNGKLRLVGNAASEPQIIFNAFSAIRDAGQGKPDVMRHMLEIIGVLKTLADAPDERAALDRQLAYIENHIETHFKGTPDEKILTRLLEKARDNKD